MRRTNLKVFRVQQKKSQFEMAQALGVTRGTYAAVERGKRNGSQRFWRTFQSTFGIPDEALWGYMKPDEE